MLKLLVNKQASSTAVHDGNSAVVTLLVVEKLQCKLSDDSLTSSAPKG